MILTESILDTLRDGLSLKSYISEHKQLLETPYHPAAESPQAMVDGHSMHTGNPTPFGNILSQQMIE